MWHFLDRQLQLQMLLYDLLKQQNYMGIDQSWVLLQRLNDYGIFKGNLKWIILDNATNNNITFVQLL